MTELLHKFHIPVMGSGHSVDTPIRVAPFGISAVISLVDDLLFEKIRKFYCEKFDLPFERIARNVEDGRAKRTTAYLDMVHDIVQIKFQAIKALPFFEKNDKQKYFELLPEESPVKQDYLSLLKMDAGSERTALEENLTDRMRAGSIDVNIMVKLDKMNRTQKGEMLSAEYSDAKAALRGYAKSKLTSSVVFSAGINQSLFGYMAKYKDFYRDAAGEIKKKVIIKVSDFRSALIQGKFMAKKGLEIYEFRIESGLNCGGHAFASNGELLPLLMKEFKEKRDQLAGQFKPFIKKHYEKLDIHHDDTLFDQPALLTVQGGIGTKGEVARLEKEYNVDMTGWASPFLLVPEATPIDKTTIEQLRDADESAFYLSDASPLGVPFNNLRNSVSELDRQKKIADGKPGSSCPKQFLVSNTEFSEAPICVASKKYQGQKLTEIEETTMAVLDEVDKDHATEYTLAKSCICDHLGNGALIALGIEEADKSPASICPGANAAWFTDIYTLREMIDHIYGRGSCLVSKERPHMFAKELKMYVDFYRKKVFRFRDKDARTLKELTSFHANMLKSMDYIEELAQQTSFEDENLPSILPTVQKGRDEMNSLFEIVQERA